MGQDNFKLRYTPNENLAVDESCVPFEGHVKFLQYNKVSSVLYWYLQLVHVYHNNNGIIYNLLSVLIYFLHLLFHHFHTL